MLTLTTLLMAFTFTVANADDAMAQRRGKLPPPPIEIEADAIFRDAFIQVMAGEGRDWMLQPTRPRGPAASGRPPLAHEEMTWRRNDGSHVRVWYARYASSEDAEVALAWRREVIPIATFVVKGLGDEAFYPSTGSKSSSNRSNLLFRRGPFVFVVSRSETLESPPPPDPDKLATVSCAAPHCVVISNGEAVMLEGNPLARMSALFLAAADGVLDGRIAR
jgi:hypothetical protein